MGPKRKTFRVHEALLCDRSEYFRATFQGSFSEATTKELYLPDDNDASFQIFVNWLYGGDQHVGMPKTDDELEAVFGLLALAEKVLVNHLRNLAADVIRAYYRETKARVLARDLGFVFENTTAHLLQRSLAVVAAMQTLKLCANKSLPADFKELVLKGGEVAAAYTKYMLYSLEFARGTRVEHMLDKERSCTFHIHEGTEVCKGPGVRKMEELEEGVGGSGGGKGLRGVVLRETSDGASSERWESRGEGANDLVAWLGGDGFFPHLRR